MPRKKKPTLKVKSTRAKQNFPRRARKPDKKHTVMSEMELYDYYKKLYKEYELKTQSQGEAMNSEMIDNFQSFIYTLKSMKESNREKGGRLSMKRLVEDLVKMQKYKIGRTQALAEKKFLEEELNKDNISLNEIMMGRNEDQIKSWLREEYWKRKNQQNIKSKQDQIEFTSYWKEWVSENVYGSK